MPPKGSAAKAKTKDQEMTAKTQIDKSNAEGDYDGLIEKCEQAQVICASDFWQAGFHARFEKKKECYENLLKFMKENKPEKLYKKKDLSAFNGLKNKLTDAVVDMGAYTRDAMAIVEEMQHYLGQMTMYKSQMPKKPDFDNQKGTISFRKNM